MVSLSKLRKQVFASPSFLSSAEQIIADASANNLIRLQEELGRGEITPERQKKNAPVLSASVKQYGIYHANLLFGTAMFLDRAIRTAMNKLINISVTGS